MRRFLRLLIRVLVSLLVLGIACIAVMVPMADVQVGPHGVHERLLFPLPGGRTIGMRMHGVSGEHVRIPGFLDGPVVRREADGRWEARWWCEDRVLARRGAGDRLVIDCSGTQRVLDLAPVVPPAPIQGMPARVAVLSDVEGNAVFLHAALRAMGVTDAAGRWAYGTGHLVMVGDSVDRGRDVAEVLWTLRALQRDAARAGGAVHVVLGNHDQYALHGKVAYAHPEHAYALRRIAAPGTAFARGTVLGDWLAAQPVAVRLGQTLFVHGGLHPRMVRPEVTVDAVNRASARYWTHGREGGRTLVLDAAFATRGMTQTRVLFPSPQSRWPLDTAEVASTLRHLGATRVVVGHTTVRRVTSLHGGKVLAVNVNNNASRPEVLFFEAGVPVVRDIGVPRRLKPPVQRTTRPFEPSQPGDRALLRAVLAESRRLSALPYPY